MMARPLSTMSPQPDQAGEAWHGPYGPPLSEVSFAALQEWSVAKASPHSSPVQETQSALPLMFARCSFWSAKPTRQKWVASE